MTFIPMTDYTITTLEEHVKSLDIRQPWYFDGESLESPKYIFVKDDEQLFRDCEILRASLKSKYPMIQHNGGFILDDNIVYISCGSDGHDNGISLSA